MRSLHSHDDVPIFRDGGSANLGIHLVQTLFQPSSHPVPDDIQERQHAGLRPIDISVNRDVTLDGYRGKYLEFTRKAAEIDCGWGGWDGWPASSPSARDEDDQLWILDVNGAPLVIDAFSSPEASETVKTELRQIVESIQIEP